MTRPRPPLTCIAVGRFASPHTRFGMIVGAQGTLRRRRHTSAPLKGFGFSISYAGRDARDAKPRFHMRAYIQKG